MKNPTRGANREFNSLFEIVAVEEEMSLDWQGFRLVVQKELLVVLGRL